MPWADLLTPEPGKPATHAPLQFLLWASPSTEGELLEGGRTQSFEGTFDGQLHDGPVAIPLRRVRLLRSVVIVDEGQSNTLQALRDSQFYDPLPGFGTGFREDQFFPELGPHVQSEGDRVGTGLLAPALNLETIRSPFGEKVIGRSGATAEEMDVISGFAVASGSLQFSGKIISARDPFILR